METYIEKYKGAQEKSEINKKKKAVLKGGGGAADLSDGEEEQDELERSKSLLRSLSQTRQRWYDIVDPQEINCIIQKFVMALIWGFGAPLTASARPKYSLFLSE